MEVANGGPKQTPGCSIRPTFKPNFISAIGPARNCIYYRSKLLGPCNGLDVDDLLTF